jgi:hypothetical protein
MKVPILDAETANCWQDHAPLCGDDDDGSLYPPAVYGQASIYDPAAKAFYVVGGTQGNPTFKVQYGSYFSHRSFFSGLAYFMNVHRLNLVPGQWEALYVRPPDFEHPDAPTPRYNHKNFKTFKVNPNVI